MAPVSKAMCAERSAGVRRALGRGHAAGAKKSCGHGRSLWSVADARLLCGGDVVGADQVLAYPYTKLAVIPADAAPATSEAPDIY